MSIFPWLPCVTAWFARPQRFNNLISGHQLSSKCRRKGWDKSLRRHLSWWVDELEDRCLLSAAHDIVGLTELRADATYSAIDGRLDNGQRIGVAVIDTGVFAAHQDLRDHFLYYVDAVNGTQSSNVNDARDPNGHGTHVAGTVLGGFSGQLGDTVGVAPQAGLVAIRGLMSPGDRQPQYDPVLYGLNWVLQNYQTYNIRVINMSLGSPANLNTAPAANDYSRVIDSLESHGITVVVSSGNSFAQYNAIGQSHPAVFATLSVANTIHSNSTEIDGGGQQGDTIIGVDFSPSADTLSVTSQRSTMSNQVAAPGTAIQSSWNNGAYQLASGTSMASPMVAGMVVLMQDAAMTFGGRYLSTDEVYNIVRTTADIIIDNPDPDTYRVRLDANGQPIIPRLPNGQIDRSQLENLVETGQAFRRINIEKAIQAVRSLVSQGSVGGGGGGGGGGGQSSDTNNTISTAVVLPPLNGTAAFDFQGRVGQDGQTVIGDSDVDLFKLILETPGSLNIVTEPISGGQSFDPYLRLFNSAGAEIAFSDDLNGVYPGLQTGSLPAGTYYIGLSSFDNGAYNVVSGSGAQGGRSAGDYLVTVTTTNPDPNGVIQGAVPIDLTSPNFVWDATSQAFQAGIFVSNKVTSEINSDPHPLHDDDPIRFPERLQIGPTDVDIYRITAPDTGSLYVDIDASSVYGTNAVDSYVVAYRLESNGALTVVGVNDDDGFTTDSFLSVAVEIGRTYFIALTTFGNRNFNPFDPSGRVSSSSEVGLLDAYFSFSNGDVNGTAFADINLANPLFDPDGDGLGTFPGSIGADNGVPLSGANNGFKDVDFLKFTAPQSGPLQVSLSSPDGTLNPVLGIWSLNADQSDIVLVREIAGQTPNVILDVELGETIWISITGLGNSNFNWAAPASGTGGDTGNYSLTTRYISESQFRGFSNNTINLNTPTPVTVGVQVAEEIGTDGFVTTGNTDVDLFTLTPTVSGLFTIRTTTSQEGSADTYLRLFNQNGQELAFNDNASAFTSGSQIQANLTAGQVYFIGVTGSPISGVRPAYDPFSGNGVSPGSIGTYQLFVTAPAAELPTVSLSISASSVAEASGSSTITATLSAISTSDVAVTLAFSGSATNGVDYTRSNSQIIIPAGSLTGSMTLTAVQDGAVEGNESVLVDIAGVVNGLESGSQQVIANIIDDDQPTVILTVSPDSFAEGSGGTTVTATLSTISSSSVTVSLGFTGVATSVSDYLPSNSQIVIPAGSLSGSITLSALQDSLIEGDEAVVVDIVGVLNGLESGNQRVVATIIDDDFPTVTLSLSSTTLQENVGVTTLFVSLSAASNSNVVVTLGLSGSATTAADYNFVGTLVIILAGTLVGTVTLTATPDGLIEGNETIIIDINNVTGGTEAGAQQVIATILDDDQLPNVSLSASTPSMAETAGLSVITASLSSISNSDVIVTLGFSGSATPISDYTQSASQIVIPAGSLSSSVALSAASDQELESAESVVVEMIAAINAVLSGATQVAVQVVDDDHAPIFITSPSVTAPENTIGVMTVVATDADIPQIPTYSLTGGSDQNRFNISSTGVLTFKSVPDFESPTDEGADNVYVVEVTASDGHGGSTTQNITITVTNLNEQPQLQVGEEAAIWIKKRPAVKVLPAITVGGPSNLAGGTLTISINALASRRAPIDSVSIPSSAHFETSSTQQTFGGRFTLQIQLNQNATSAVIQTFLRGITFATKAAGLRLQSRTLDVGLSDANGNSDFVIQTILVQKK